MHMLPSPARRPKNWDSTCGICRKNYLDWLSDLNVSVDTKKLMIKAMKEVVTRDHPPKHPRVDHEALLDDKGLEKFCTNNSKRL